ncbi:MAG: class I SAM-dependent methyltransferase [Alphaproteobacteria bacterium]|jgi:SAM-dependent methyltransferase
MNDDAVLLYNRSAWDEKVRQGNVWTQPVSAERVARARQGEFEVLLTPVKPVPADWLGDVRGRRLLCLACGGGQQGPLFAAAGADVTVFDNSPAQLAQDEAVAARDGLYLRTEQGDMRDLSRFEEGSFDLIFHPVSNCFVDGIERVWRECFRVLKPGGLLLSGFANPLIYIFDFREWDEKGRLSVRYKIPYADTEQLPPEDLERRRNAHEPLEFGHSLEEQIGGLLKAGFLLSGFYEDSAGGDLLDPYIDTFIATRALKP